jgi:hypothetical protein
MRMKTTTSNEESHIRKSMRISIGVNTALIHVPRDGQYS